MDALKVEDEKERNNLIKKNFSERGRVILMSEKLERLERLERLEMANRDVEDAIKANELRFSSQKNV